MSNKGLVTQLIPQFDELCILGLAMSSTVDVKSHDQWHGNLACTEDTPRHESLRLTLCT
jgi:hypothetical protein